ncbi:O-antigen ligase family protein [Massilia sp. LXY-6]|uniref:O-antigen ligase family protein n=1 Tax=Massilia sp. LXY-6 TaxID=3379823 RepID=UPI003EE09ED0
MPWYDTAAVRKPVSLVLPAAPFITLAVLGVLCLNFVWAYRHDEQRCIEIVLLCAGALTILGCVVMGGAVSIRLSAHRPLLAFFILGLLSTASALSLRHAIYEWSSFVLLALLAGAIATELAKSGTTGLSGILQLAGIACALHSLRVLIMYAASLASGYQPDMHALAVGFSNARFLNHTQTALLPLIVLLSLQAPAASAARRTWFVLAAFWWSLLFVSEARATILALGAGGVLALALRGSHARGFLRTMALAALAGAILYVLGFILLPTLVGLHPVGMPSNVVARTASDPSSGRTLLWTLALQWIAAHPWLGIGPHHFAHVGHKLYIGAHPHDWLLQIGVEWGIPALLCLLGALALGARALVRSGQRIADDDLRNQRILVALLTTCAAIFVDGLFSGVLVMPQSQLAIALVIGCAAGWVRSLGAAAETAPSRWTRPITGVLAAAALCGLVWSVAPSFMQHARGEPLTPAEQAINDKVNWPRMWEAGYF